MNNGLLLVNLGSPDSTAVADVRAYLREFLMDPRVIDVPTALRAVIVYGFVLPFRPARSAEAYEKIWTTEGSPLVAISSRVQRLVQRRLEFPVELAMRYGNPSIPAAVEKLRAAGVTNLQVFPLFPHYAMSSFETAVERVREVVERNAPEMQLSVIRPYYEAPAYVDALAASARAFLNDPYDHVLFSFHGVPERHLRKTDPTNAHCLEAQNCCETRNPAHSTCYRAHCFATVRAFAAKAGLQPGTYSTAFQSRLGRDEWIKPATDQELVRLAREGKRRLVVLCPSFVADCLETTEEIGIRGRELFLSSGGESFTLVPCLNEHPKWIDAICAMAQEDQNDGLLQITHTA